MSFCSSREKQFQCRERKGAQGSSPAHPGTMRREQRGSQRNQTVSRATHCPLLVHFREQNQSPEPAGGGWTTGRPSIAALRAVGSPGGGGRGACPRSHPRPPCPQSPAALPEASMQSGQMLRMPSPSDRIQSETLALSPAASPTPGPSLSVLIRVPPAQPLNQFHCAEKLVILHETCPLTPNYTS